MALTAAWDLDLRAQAFRAGADDVFSVREPIEELVRAARRLAGDGQEATSKQLRGRPLPFAPSPTAGSAHGQRGADVLIASAPLAFGPKCLEGKTLRTSR